MKINKRFIACVAICGLISAVATQAVSAETPPTVDKTYRPATQGRPFAGPSFVGAGKAVALEMNHLQVLPVSVTGTTAGFKLNLDGAKSLTQGRAAHVMIQSATDAKAPPVVVVDFGKEFSGRLQIWGTAGATVTVTIGESLAECKRVIRFSPRVRKIDNSGPFTLKLAGSKPASTPYSAFRYAQLIFPKGSAVEITGVTCDFKYYPVQYWGSFSCSDRLLTRIWYTGAYTAHLCMQEEIWDAPKRDRGLWIGDLQVTGQTINTVFADKTLMEKSIATVRAQCQGKQPPPHMPTKDVNNIPGYSAAWFCTLADFYRASGDRKFLVSQQANIVSLLKFQQTQFNTGHLFVGLQHGKKEWTFCDWSPGFVLDGPLTRATTNLYIIHGVDEAVHLLRQLGDTSNADNFAKWAKQLTAAARKNYLDPKTQTYGNRLQENIMAVLSHTATVAQCQQIYGRVLKAGSPAWSPAPDPKRQSREAITPYYGYFLLRAMGQLDKHQEAIDFIRYYWGDMLRRGATTFWEMFDPSWPDDLNVELNKVPYLSLSHGWATGPTSYLSEFVLGVRSTGPGFKTVEIQPELGDLKWAEGDVPTPHGVIHVRADHRAGGTSVTVTLPSGVVATISAGGRTLMANKPGVYRVPSR